MKTTLPFLGLAVILMTLGMQLANATTMSPARIGDDVRPSATKLEGYVFPAPVVDAGPEAEPKPYTCDAHADCLDLAGYLTRAAFDWVPVDHFTMWGESEDEARSRVSAICRGVATVAMDPKEPPLVTGSHTRARSGLYVLKQAAIESSFSDYVDAGFCNDRAWRMSPEGQRTMRRGECDSGSAFTVWQMHVDENAGALTDLGWKAKAEKPTGPIVRGVDAVRDRVLAARIATHWLRTRPEVWGSSSYARQKAEAWFAKHPPNFSLGSL